MNRGESTVFYTIVRGLFRAITRVAKNPRVYGREWLRDVDGKILMCNHRTWFDPVLVAVITPKHLHFMAKKELVQNKLVALMGKWVGVVPIDREGADVKAIKTSMALLTEGEAMLIFPEGTRNRTGGEELLDFRKGVAFLATKSMADVIPVYIHAHRKNGRTLVDVGEPVSVANAIEGVPKRQQIDALNAELERSMDALKQAR